jgi:hypothetical protein
VLWLAMKPVGRDDPTVLRQNALRATEGRAMAGEESFSDGVYRNILQITLMGMAPLCIDMYQGRTQVAAKYSTAEHTERRTLGGLVAYLLIVPALVAFMAAPAVAVAVGAVVGVVGVAVGRRAGRRLRWQQAESGFSSSEAKSGQPA